MLLLPKFIRLGMLRSEKNNFMIVDDKKWDSRQSYVVVLYDPALDKRLVVKQDEWTEFRKEQQLQQEYKKQEKENMVDF